MALSLLSLLKNRWHTVFAIMGITFVIALVITFVQPLKYRANTRLLIIQRATYTFDTYNALKAAERVAENLTSIVYTTDFYNQVMDEPVSFDRRIFNVSETKRRKMWKKMVDATITRGTGFLTVSVYHTNPKEAEKIAGAVASVLSQKGWEYVGGGDIQVKTVDQPLVSKYPVKPNIILNAISGLVLGLVFGVLYAAGLARFRHGKGLHIPRDHTGHGANHPHDHEQNKSAHGYAVSYLNTQPQMALETAGAHEEWFK